MSASRWQILLRIAAGMGIAPRAFWALSLVEWRALTEQAGTGPRWADFAPIATGHPDTDTRDTHAANE